MKISFICPSRNNLKYLRWSFDSIIKNRGTHSIEFCVWDDFSDDGTSEWCRETESQSLDGVVFKWNRNDGPARLGHTILYDKIVRELASNDLCIIWHADMYLCPGALDAIENLMFLKTKFNRPNFNRVVSLTRIEPPLHPPGKEKITRDFGTEPENFNEVALLEDLKQYPLYLRRVEKDIPTKGVFAPWAFWRDEFLEIGGHDPLFAPQSKEDSDIWNRLLLNGVEFLQTWTGFVYHMTCRGSRFNPTLTTIGKNSSEWEEQNLRSTRNFIRKWGSMVKHDEYLHPIVPQKYNIGIVIKNCTWGLLYNLEPWCDHLKCDIEPELLDRYIEFEQFRTKFKLEEKLKKDPKPLPNIIVEIDGYNFDQVDMTNITYLSDILTDSGNIGEYYIGNLKLNIKSLETYEKNLIVVQNEN